MPSMPGLQSVRAQELLVAIAVAAICVVGRAAAQAGSATGAHRDPTVEDIVATREIVEQHLSPDGRTVAFTVRRARLVTDDYETRLMLIGVTSGARPREAWTASSIENLRWTPDGTALTFIAPAPGGREVLRLDPTRRSPLPLLPTSLPVLAFEWSPHGDLALLVQDTIDRATRQHWADDGIIYDSTLTVADLRTGTGSLSRPERILRWASATSRFDTVWTAPDAIAEMVWSPDGTRLAVRYRASSRPEDVNNMDIGVVSPTTKILEPVVTWKGWEERPRWAPDGNALVFQSQGPLRNGDPQWVQNNSLYVSRLDGLPPTGLARSNELREAHPLAWSPDGREVLFESGGHGGGKVGVIPLGERPRQLATTSENLSRCSVSAGSRVISCIRQGLTVPPEIAVLHSRSGAVRTLTHLHPEYDTIRLGAAREIRWANRYGAQTNGFLFTPPDFRTGRRYPFVISLYGFSSIFSAQGQWIASLPVATLTADGFVVLLMNHPDYGPFRWGGDEAEVATFWERDNTLASIVAAVDTLVAMGIADRLRGGIMGWSMGSYWADVAITRTSVFRTASSGEIGARTSGTYWAGNAQTRYLQRSFFGGPPTGASYASYARTAPPLTPPPRDVPVLREFDTESVWGLEYASWLEQGAMMEMVFYPNAGHVFERPAQRLSSLRRNRAWFSFWLQGITQQGWVSAAEYRRWQGWRTQIANDQAAEHGDSTGRAVPMRAPASGNASRPPPAGPRTSD